MITVKQSDSPAEQWNAPVQPVTKSTQLTYSELLRENDRLRRVSEELAEAAEEVCRLADVGVAVPESAYNLCRAALARRRT